MEAFESYSSKPHGAKRDFVVRNDVHHSFCFSQGFSCYPGLKEGLEDLHRPKSYLSLVSMVILGLAGCLGADSISQTDSLMSDIRYRVK